jgi:hypothetical protein
MQSRRMGLRSRNATQAAVILLASVVSKAGLALRVDIVYFIRLGSPRPHKELFRICNFEFAL